MPTKLNVIAELKQQLQQFKADAATQHVGTVLEVGDGIARIAGLSNVMASEMLEFGHDIYGVALNLEEGMVGAVVLGDAGQIKEGDMVKSTGRVLSIPVGDAFLGRVVDPLGRPIDGKGAIKENAFYPIEKIAPGVIAREPVNTPLQTGIKA